MLRWTIPSRTARGRRPHQALILVQIARVGRRSRGRDAGRGRPGSSRSAPRSGGSGTRGCCGGRPGRAAASPRPGLSSTARRVARRSAARFGPPAEQRLQQGAGLAAPIRQVAQPARAAGRPAVDRPGQRRRLGQGLGRPRGSLRASASAAGRSQRIREGPRAAPTGRSSSSATPVGPASTAARIGTGRPRARAAARGSPRRRGAPAGAAARGAGARARASSRRVDRRPVASGATWSGQQDDPRRAVGRQGLAAARRVMRAPDGLVAGELQGEERRDPRGARRARARSPVGRRGAARRPTSAGPAGAARHSGRLRRRRRKRRLAGPRPTAAGEIRGNGRGGSRSVARAHGLPASSPRRPSRTTARPSGLADRRRPARQGPLPCKGELLEARLEVGRLAVELGAPVDEEPDRTALELRRVDAGRHRTPAIPAPATASASAARAASAAPPVAGRHRRGAARRSARTRSASTRIPVSGSAGATATSAEPGRSRGRRRRGRRTPGHGP